MIVDTHMHLGWDYTFDEDFTKQVEHENVKNKSAWRCQSSEKLLHDLRLFSCAVIAE